MNALAGTNNTKFSGMIGGHVLAPGRYQATLLATDAAGRHSTAKRLTLQIVRG